MASNPELLPIKVAVAGNRASIMTKLASGSRAIANWSQIKKKPTSKPQHQSPPITKPVQRLPRMPAQNRPAARSRTQSPLPLPGTRYLAPPQQGTRALYRARTRCRLETPRPGRQGPTTNRYRLIPARQEPSMGVQSRCARCAARPMPYQRSQQTPSPQQG